MLSLLIVVLLVIFISWLTISYFFGEVICEKLDKITDKFDKKNKKGEM